MGQISEALNRTLDQVSGAMQNIGLHSRALARSSEGLSAVSRQMGAGAEETSAKASVVAAAAEQTTLRLNLVAAATEEMTASILEISKSAGAAERVVARAVERADVAELTMSRLGGSMATIGEVVTVIQSIAHQTKMLALNAAIEAHHAGTAGTGSGRRD